ncbi:MAG: aldo/keto reductase [Chloroflexi bacterium AL-W]|nr:aldo/keto reductase [Chloroflexi bacterium AL-N1]NOK67695.1 aldo/keto reductase [Chloroflexi bacterium AL-N10]NOK75535.1 aldo/keto reductase [Chloroflexi bacterium AL-N5]NOK82323.1 aldo/keto reductase [Chloroflexi bacterium AL-W]NOK90168.1 aldo/keto reductase [Chloroflexi bacterium AL-N15]
MDGRSLGTTGLAVSRIGIGLAALGRPGYVNLGHASDLAGQYGVDMMQQRTHQVLDAAWDAGIRYFDTARSYGRGEAFLGSWLQSRQFAPTDLVVGSKWGYTYTAGWQVEAVAHEVKEHSATVLQRQWGETQSNLGMYLDLYQIHSATLDSGVLDNQEVLTELAQLKSRGVRIGLSLSGLDQTEVLRRALAIIFDGERLFDVVQVTWNVLEPSVGAVLQEAHTSGMGVIVKEVLANGRLTTRNTEPAFAAQLSLLQREAVRLHTTVDALVIAAVLRQPWADVVLSGAATVDQLQANIQALYVSLDEETVAMLNTLVEPPELYWATRRSLRWN